ncbi:MAG: single-stranded-DNA-specific exonuclease RecJ [Candidatus Magasanikbacteria bacterium]
MQKRWEILPKPPKELYEKFPELPEAVVDLLYHRNITTQEAIDEFLHPEYSKDVHDPFLFKEMKHAVKRIFKAIEKEEKIVVHGDYDADGVSGATILITTLRELGAKHLDVFLPHRELDGYGLNANTVELLATSNTKLIITCDCGISNTEEVNLANKKGIDVIITDHHTIPEKLPKAEAILHPKVQGETYPDKNLAGGAVAFKLAQGLLRKHKEDGKELESGLSHEAIEKWLLDMVAIASIADMVPLLGESRTLTKYGLIVLNKTKRIGLQKLLLEARLMNDDGSLKNVIDADTIGFKIAPRINAAGRLQHANVAYGLMMTTNPIEAVDLAFTLDKNNTERQKITEKCLKEAITQIEKDKTVQPILLAFGKEWPSGIVGLMAGKLKDKYGKPALVMTSRGDEIVGSGRSISGFNAIESLQELSDVFLKFGGHPMAFGFTLAPGETVQTLREKLTKKYLEKTVGMDLTPILQIDAEIDLENVNWELYDILEKFAPFGKDNEKPKYASMNVTLQDVAPLGKDKKHLKIMLQSKTGKIKQAIGWHMCNENTPGENWCKLLKKGNMVDVAFEIDVNEWNGNRELRLQIIDIKKHE